MVISSKKLIESKSSLRKEGHSILDKEKSELQLIIKQLLKSQETKNEMIKKFSLEIMSLKQSIKEKDNEIWAKDDVIRRLKEKISFIKENFRSE
jgi:hypothetical protein